MADAIFRVADVQSITGASDLDYERVRVTLRDGHYFELAPNDRKKFIANFVDAVAQNKVLFGLDTSVVSSTSSTKRTKFSE